MPRILRNWIAPRRRPSPDPRAGDPYLESLLTQLMQLRGAGGRPAAQRRG